jgi:hypothetical protein
MNMMLRKARSQLGIVSLSVASLLAFGSWPDELAQSPRKRMMKILLLLMRTPEDVVVNFAPQRENQSLARKAHGQVPIANS